MKSSLKIFNYKIPNYLIFLLFFAFISRIIQIYPNIFPFSFDHGKDSLAILYLTKSLKAPLIGPWTSIPGLFFGPAWYYLLAPGYLLSGGNPISAIFTMIILNLITIFLAYRHFGKLEATFVTTASAWTMLSTSAWNPFPIPLLILIILIIIKKQNLSSKQLLFLGILISLQFHFSSAYAIFSLIGIFFILGIYNYQKKLALNLKKITYWFLGLAIPFIPQLLFEVRHNFIETRAIIDYFTNPPENQAKTKLIQIFITSLNEYKTIFLPNIHNSSLAILILFIFIVLLFRSIFKRYKKNIKVHYFGELLFFVIIPLFGFSFIHFNVWYIYASFPVILLFVTQYLKKISPKIQNAIMVTLIILQIYNLFYFIKVDRKQLIANKDFYPAKIKAIQTVKELSQEKPYSSYQYESDIYDFPYQYIYIYQAIHGQKLPIEFSYQPGKQDYIRQKADLIKNLPKFKQEKPEYIFYIVEKPQYPNLLKDWWNQQNYKKIIKEVKITPDLTVYQALPKYPI